MDFHSKSTGNRYSLQTKFHNIGYEGQEKLLQSKISIIGLGALGSVVSLQLSRAGIGLIRLIDYDKCSITNLHRQIIYDEYDVKERKYKATAAREHLTKGNSTIRLKPIIQKVDENNIEEVIGSSQLIIDATDNLETRFVINEYCYHKRIPWIYGGVLGSKGMTYNFLPGLGICFRCLFRDESKASISKNTNKVGVINMITGIIGSVQASETIKILLNSKEISTDLKIFDIWKNEFISITPRKKSSCPICGRRDYSPNGSTNM